MGYQLRLGRVTKESKTRFVGLTEEVAQKVIGEGKSLYYPPFHTQLFELGKETKCGGMVPFYDFEMEENDFLICPKESLEAIIEEYRASIHSYFESCLEDIRQGPTLTKMESDARSKVNEWSGKWGFLPYSLDRSQEMISSWNYEYVIFNLVHIHRTFDWENNYLIYSGW